MWAAADGSGGGVAHATVAHTLLTRVRAQGDAAPTAAAAAAAAARRGLPCEQRIFCLLLARTASVCLHIMRGTRGSVDTYSRWTFTAHVD